VVHDPGREAHEVLCLIGHDDLQATASPAPAGRRQRRIAGQRRAHLVRHRP
jgi:hypothetical protein